MELALRTKLGLRAICPKVEYLEKLIFPRVDFILPSSSCPLQQEVENTWHPETENGREANGHQAGRINLRV
jgi:hypothetical protein